MPDLNSKLGPLVWHEDFGEVYLWDVPWEDPLVTQDESGNRIASTTEGLWFPLDEAVDSPTAAQRRDLPDAAFAAVFDDPRTGLKRRILPHHINSVRDPDADGTVDVPRLRNALARFGQLRGVPDDVRSRARSHIDAHAERLGIGAGDNQDACKTGHGKRKRKGMDKNDSTPQIDWAECAARYAEAELFEDVVSVADYELATEDADDAALEQMGVDRSDLLSPAGESYLGILVGHMAVDSKINRNGRLYDPEGEDGQPGMRQNVERWAGIIAQAFDERKGSIAGNLDHDSPFTGATLDGIALEFIGVRREGEKVAFKAGIMKTSRGRNLKVVAAHKMPIGMSTVASGVSEERTMDEDNPFHFANPGHVGKTYRHITGFVLHQADAVKEPSAEVYATLARMPREAREAYECLAGLTESAAPSPIADPEPVEPVEPEPAAAATAEAAEDPQLTGSITPADTTQEHQEEPEMTKDELLKMIESLDEDQIATIGEKLVPGLAAQVKDLSAKVEASEATVAALRDQLTDAKAIAEALQQAHAASTAEAEAKTVQLALQQAADLACEGKTFTAERRAYILEGAFVLPEGEDVTLESAAAEFAVARSKRYDETIAPKMPPPKGENERRVAGVPTETDVREFAGDVLTLPYGATIEPPKQ